MLKNSHISPFFLDWQWNEQNFWVQIEGKKNTVLIKQNQLRTWFWIISLLFSCLKFDELFFKALRNFKPFHEGFCKKTGKSKFLYFFQRIFCFSELFKSQSSRVNIFNIFLFCKFVCYCQVYLVTFETLISKVHSFSWSKICFYLTVMTSRYQASS